MGSRRRASVRQAVVLLVAMVLAGCAGTSQSEAGVDTELLVARPEWGQLFADAGTSGSFVLREIGAGQTMVWNEVRAKEPRRPASTFKILNSLIILETGVLRDVDTIVPWDGVIRGSEVWNRDHSLRTGIEVSAVWAFQELARQVGPDRMQQWVTGADYGNANIGGGIDGFWLTGDLRITPLEQLDFLERLVLGDLPFSPEATSSVQEILVRERGDGWSWSHKTGTALIEEPDLGWLVGATNHDGRSFVFALNLDLASAEDTGVALDPQVRQTIAREILTAEGALPR